MALSDLVLVHGCAHAGDCWDLVVAELARDAPQLRVLAVDLPGRADKPADLSAIRIADCVDSVVAEIESLGGVQALFCVDSCHDVMISEPKWLAGVLIERCRLHS